MSEEYTEKKPVVDKEKCIGCCLCPTVNFEYPDFKMVQTEQGETYAVQQAESEICRVAEMDASGQPVLDLVFLGMGEDGHVASLFPGDQEAIESQAVYRAVTGPKPPPRRITLGYRTLAAAREVWVLASGEGKKEALKNSLADDGDTPLARVLQSRKNTEIFTDFILE